MDLMNSAELTRIVKRTADRHGYRNNNAFALLAIGNQFMANGNTVLFGQLILRGIYEGLGHESLAKAQYPVCPNCGQRHP